MPSGCGPVGPTRVSLLPIEAPNIDPLLTAAPVVATILGVGFEWKTSSSDLGRFYLYRKGVQIGGWDESDKRWMDYDAGAKKWAPGYPPWYVDQLSPNGKKSVDPLFFGVDRKEIPQMETFSVNGQQVPFLAVKEAFGSDTLSDDSGKLRIAVGGTKELCDTIMSDMKSHPALTSMSNRFLVQCYRPGAWPVEVFKRPAGEGFFISILGPPDKRGRSVEYHTQVAYEGPVKLAEAMDGALRRADPLYNPNSTPDLTKPKPPLAPLAPPAPEPASALDTTWFMIALLVAFLFGGKRNANSKRMA